MTPGTTEKLQQKYQNLNLVFNPEFLTERSKTLTLSIKPLYFGW